MTLPLGQRALRERGALHRLRDERAESKGVRRRDCEKPLTLRSGACSATLQRHCRTPGRAPAAAPGQSSWIVTEVIATGESGRSRAFRGALTIWSTMSRPFVTWPNSV